MPHWKYLPLSRLWENVSNYKMLLLLLSFLSCAVSEVQTVGWTSVKFPVSQIKTSTSKSLNKQTNKNSFSPRARHVRGFLTYSVLASHERQSGRRGYQLEPVVWWRGDGANLADSRVTMDKPWVSSYQHLLQNHAAPFPFYLPSLFFFHPYMPGCVRA